MSKPDFSSVVKPMSTEHLRVMIGAIMTELRLRKAADTVVTEKDLDFTRDKAIEKAAKAEKRAAEKAAYLERKAEVASRPFGVKRASDGKLLKRRFTDQAQAIAAAAELTTSMKTVYEAVEVAVAA